MGQHKVIALRVCLKCGAQETTDAEGMARHASECTPDRARVIRRRRGRCIDCGKPSLPYVKCPTHRFQSRLTRILNRGADYGLFVKSFKADDRHAYYEMGDEHAKVGQRGFYNTRWGGGAPRGFFPFVQAYLRQSGRPMHEDMIVGAFTDYRRERAARGHLEA